MQHEFPLTAHDGSGAAEPDDLDAAIERLSAKVGELCVELDRTRKNIADLLRHVSRGEGSCVGPNCGQEILWVLHANGVRAPYNYDGSQHFTTCVDRELFKKGFGGGKKDA